MKLVYVNSADSRSVQSPHITYFFAICPCCPGPPPDSPPAPPNCEFSTGRNKLNTIFSHMYVFMYVCIYVCMICIYIYTYEFMYVCMYVHVCTRVYMSVHVCTCLHMRVQKCPSRLGNPNDHVTRSVHKRTQSRPRNHAAASKGRGPSAN